MEKLLHPSDTEGRKCGIDSAVKDKKYLIFFDLSKCARISTEYRSCPTTQVCVEKCPDKNFLYNIARENLGFNELKNQLICKTDVKLNEIYRLDQIDMLVKAEKCANWYLESTSIVGRCFPKRIWPEFVNSTITDPDLQHAEKFVKAVAQIEDVLKKVYQDIKETKLVYIARE